MAYSFSALKLYETCARQFHEVRILNLHPRQETEQTIWGTQVHEASELHVRDGKEFEFDFPGQDVVQAIARSSGDKYCELEMAVNEKLEAVAFDAPDAFIRGIADVVIVKGDQGRVLDYKGLALDTLLPTPDGFTTMGEVRVGDTLFAESGEQCTVIGKSQVKHLPCYQVTFEDTSTVVCDEEHLWKLVGGTVLPVTQLRTKTRGVGRPTGKAQIAVAAPLALPDAELPIDPYVLGLWLADGKHTSGEISKPDQFVWDEVQRRGYPVSMETGGKQACPTRTAQGLVKQLRTFGLLGNKHIPAEYLRAGYQQRLDLLRGLMDGDGSANPTRKQVVFTNTDHALALRVRELACSLGQRAVLNTFNAYGFGKHIIAYSVSFRPNGIQPFSLPRKRDLVLSSWGAGHSNMRGVTKVESVPSVPTQCIAVDSPDHTFLCTERMIPTHNTGSNKYPDTGQLELMSLLVFAKFPEVVKCTNALLFLKHDTITQAITKKENAMNLWAKWIGKVNRIENAKEIGVWNAKPSGLCRGWCPCTTCEHWQPKR